MNFCEDQKKLFRNSGFVDFWIILVNFRFELQGQYTFADIALRSRN